LTLFGFKALNRIAFSAIVITLSIFASDFARAESGFSGMYLQGINPRIATAIGLKEPKGVLIRDIALGEPADLAGLERGDLIVEFAEQEIDTFKKLVAVAAKTKPGQVVEVQVLRRGRDKTFKMKLSKRSGAWKVRNGEIVAIPEIGLTLASLTPKIRERFDLRWGALGVLVTLIDPAFAQSTPMERGDVVVQINQKGIWTPKQFEAKYRRAQKDGRESLLILIERMGDFQFMLLPVKKPK